jgi:tetratricopeptide (TPR) repeat protein
VETLTAERSSRRIARPRIDVRCADWDEVKRLVHDDLDEIGLFVLGARELAVDDALVVRLHLPGREQPVQLPGAVVSHLERPTGAGIAMEFRELPDESRELVRRLLAGPLPLDDQQALPIKAPLYVHPLPSVADFQGRRTELDALGGRWPRAALVSIVAQGGAGKSTLLAKLLDTFEEHVDRPHAVFVWSFYQDTDADSFLKTAILYFTGAPSSATTTLGHVYALTSALAVSGRVVLAMDGLERIQEAATGRVEDPALRFLLDQLAAGIGQTMAVITSRIGLPDLDEHKGLGFFELSLDRLTPDAANALLWSRGVEGSFEELAQLANRFGGHALTVSLLGAYLKEFHGGRISGADPLTPGEGQGEMLAAILGAFETAMTPPEVAVLERLSAFRSGTTYALLDAVFLRAAAKAGSRLEKRLLGPIAELTSTSLRQVLDRLEALKLIAREGTEDGQPVYAFHAAVKDHFYSRLMSGAKGKRVHEQVREHLENRPMEQRPMEDSELDTLEGLIHHTISAGHVDKAFRVYWERLNGYDHLGRTLGAYARGRRITQAFLDANARLDEWSMAMVMSDRGLYLEKLGEFDEAIRCHEVGLRIAKANEDHGNAAIALENQATLSLAQGRLTQAKQTADQARSHAKAADSARALRETGSLVGAALLLMGSVEQAAAAFQEALKHQGRIGIAAKGLYDRPGIRHADLLVRTGRIDEAKALTVANLDISSEHHWSQSVVRCQLVLADLALAEEDVVTAQTLVDDALAMAARWGWLEAMALGQRLRARTMVPEGNRDRVLDTLELALKMAGRGPFRVAEIDTLALMARHADPLRGLELAERAIALSREARCLYLWGEIAGLVAKIHQLRALGRPTGAELARAKGLMQKVDHPELAELEALETSIL